MPHGVANIPGQGLRDFTELVRGYGRLAAFTPIAPRMGDGLRIARPAETKPPDGTGKLAQTQIGRKLDFLA